MEAKFLILLVVASLCTLYSIEAYVFLHRPSGDSHQSGRMFLGTVGTGKCAHIGRNCMMLRDRGVNPTTFNCEHLTYQGIGPVDIRNGLGQALKCDENTFTGICTLSLDNEGGNVATYKSYVGGL